MLVVLIVSIVRKVAQSEWDCSLTEKKLATVRVGHFSLEKRRLKILDPQEIQNVLLNSKLTNDIYSQFSDLSKTMNKLEQNMKKSFAEQRTALIHEVLDLIHKSSIEMLTVHILKFVSTAGQAEMILNEDEINNILNSLDQNKLTITNNIIQLLYDKGFFDSFPNKDQAFAIYLTSSETHLLEKYGKTIPTSDGENYLSDLEYSTRESILKSLKKDSYIDTVDMKQNEITTNVNKFHFI